MEFSHLILPLLALIILILATFGYADMKSDFLNAHNSARATVKVPALTWSTEAASFAQRWVATLRDKQGCNMVHSGNKQYGENLYKWWGSPGLPQPNPAEAVKSWVSEKRDYNYASNSCAPGKVCGHYTQVVWRNTKKVGCAAVKCSPNALLVSCNYDPPGNWNGQRPYYKSVDVLKLPTDS